MTAGPSADRVSDGLIDFVTASPSPYHAVDAGAALLRAAGFRERVETDAWDAEPGGWYVARGGTLIAWWQPAGVGPTTPFRIFGAHTDSPTLKVKPRPDTGYAGWRQVGVEVYGGSLFNSWLDRDLGLAGRLVGLDGSTTLVRIGRPLLRVPQLAIHLDRSVNGDGVKLDPQRHLTPIWGLGDVRDGDLVEFVAAEAGLAAADVVAHDLAVYELTPPAYLGRDRELLAAPRLDNLSSVHAGVTALLRVAESDPGGVIPVLAAFDHEELGSASTTGAKGPLLGTVLERVLAAAGAGVDERARSFAASRCLSADAAHAVHPNYAERYEPDHRVLPNAGPVLKVNANQRYATNAPNSAAWVRAVRRAGVPSQVFVSSNSVPCGSTIGPHTASRWGIETIDVGVPLLSMHSVRELCGAADIGRLAAAAAEFLRDPA